jgi:shikimate dehydrogenase
MSIKGSTRLIGILGNPVHHSLSPAMHNALFDHFDLDMAYVPLRVENSDLAVAVQALRALNFRGANVTLPHKQAVIPLLDEVSDLSRLIGAVNTIVNDNGRLVGTTTDPIGFREGFLETGLAFKGKAVALLGNGGSARTIAFTLAMMEETAGLALVARNAEKSQRLADEIEGKTGKRPLCLSLDDYQGQAENFQIVVNTTPLGMYPDIEASPLSEEALRSSQVIYDIIYTPERTKLLQFAQRRKLNMVGGLGMLVHQGAASFKLWTGVEPDLRLMYRTVRKALRGNLLARKEPNQEPNKASLS